MFARGLPDEVRNLHEAGYTPRDPGLRAIGYREFFVEDESSSEKGAYRLSQDLDGVQALVAQNSRRYAKRQVTFFASMSKDTQERRILPHAQVGTAKPCMMNNLARRGAKQRLTLPIMREDFSLSSAPCTRSSSVVYYSLEAGRDDEATARHMVPHITQFLQRGF
jgi:tRNA A37 N6-isopentenylltransferase MiaA